MELNRFFTVIITKDDETYRNDNGDFGITVGSLNLEEVLCDGGLALNQMCSSKFEFQGFNLNDDLEGGEITVTYTVSNQEITYVEVVNPDLDPIGSGYYEQTLTGYVLSQDEQTDQGKTYYTKVETTSTETYPLFVGIIDSSTTDNFNNFRDVVAYDKIYTLRNKNVGEWWDTFWANLPEYTAVSIPVGSPLDNNYYELVSGNYVASTDTEVDTGKTYYYNIPITTIGQLRTALCNAVGLSCETVTLVNDDIQIKQYMKSTGNIPTQVTFGDLMPMICEINGVIGHIGRNGQFNFVTLSNVSKTLGAYEKTKVNFEDYETQLITGINVYESSKNLMLSYGTSGNVYGISGNIFTLTLDNYSVLETICSRILPKINTIQYTPCSLPMVISDLTLNVGDKVVSDVGTHYILSQTFSGSLLVEQTIDCPSYGEVLSPEIRDFETIVVNQRYSSIYQDQSEIRTEVNNVSSSMNNVISAMSSIAQTSDDILARVERDETRIDSNETRLEHFETAVSITTEGVTISQGTEGYYTRFTDDGMDIYTSGSKTAWAKSDGFYVTELSIGTGDENDSSSQRWYVKEANGGSTLMFLRR